MNQSFYQLTPHVVLESIDRSGFRTSGHLIQLNSYENRVFSVDLEDDSKVVAKFYRPGRWSKAAIEDEHNFLSELKNEGMPAVAPLAQKNGSTLSLHDGMFMAIFPRMRGRSPDEFIKDDLERVGRRLAQLHNLGARKEAKHRVTLSPSDDGPESLKILKKFVWPELWNRYEEAAHVIVEQLSEDLDDVEFLRIHGDCHKGNLIDDGKEFYFVDFDDFCNGPAVQDIWMLTRGDPEESEINLEKVLSGYTELRDFDEQELELADGLRGYRLISYSAWIAKRWEDPSFPKLFPDFNSYRYWLEELTLLEEIAG